MADYKIKLNKRFKLEGGEELLSPTIGYSSYGNNWR